METSVSHSTVIEIKDNISAIKLRFLERERERRIGEVNRTVSLLQLIVQYNL